MTIYDRIKNKREELGMSQQELAEKVGFKTRSAVNKIELGMRDINQTKIKAFADALETTTSYLLDGKEEVHEVSEDNLKVALFGGDGEVTDEMWEQVQIAVEGIKARAMMKKNANKKD